MLFQESRGEKRCMNALVGKVLFGVLMLLCGIIEAAEEVAFGALLESV